MHRGKTFVVGMAGEAVAAIADASLSHPNPACLGANTAYVCAIRHLILHPEDAQGGWTAAQRALQVSNLPVDGKTEVAGWLNDAEAGRLPACHPMIGFVRIAFTHAFHHLLQQSPFEAALRQTLAGGGDTDTNACIVGGLLGALHGIAAIPEHLVQAVLKSDGKLGHERPDWLHPADALELADELLLFKFFC